MFTMEELRKMYPYMSWENMNHLQESVKTINGVLYENILASGIFSYMNTEKKAKLKERVRKKPQLKGPALLILKLGRLSKN